MYICLCVYGYAFVWACVCAHVIHPCVCVCVCVCGVCLYNFCICMCARGWISPLVLRTKLGSFYGEVVLYKPGMFPLGCIGPARYLWRADSGETSGTGDAVLWLWIHPAMKPEVVSSLCLLCGDETTPGPRVTVLKDILMFELTGPKSHQVLSKVRHHPPPCAQIGTHLLSLSLTHTQTHKYTLCTSCSAHAAVCRLVHRRDWKLLCELCIVCHCT